MTHAADPVPPQVPEAVPGLIETLKNPKLYQKALAALAGAVVPVVIYSLSDGHIDGGEWAAIGTAALGAFGFTFGTKNRKL